MQQMVKFDTFLVKFDTFLECNYESKKYKGFQKFLIFFECFHFRSYDANIIYNNTYKEMIVTVCLTYI